jgi:hypothetical protein
MGPRIVVPAPVGAVVAFAGRSGSLDGLSASFRHLDRHQRGAVDVAVCERRRARWTPVFTGRIGPTRVPSVATTTQPTLH